MAQAECQASTDTIPVLCAGCGKEIEIDPDNRLLASSLCDECEETLSAPESSWRPGQD